MSTDAQKRASVKYAQKMDQLVIRPDKETGKEIRKAAEKAGQSVQQYILQAVIARMDSESDRK